MRRPVISRSAKAREGSVVLILNSLTDNQSTCQVGIGRPPCRHRRFDVSLDGHRVRLVACTAEDRSKALAVPGVKKVVGMPEPTPPYEFQPWGGVAVVATNTWAALRGRERLQIEWDHGPNAAYDSDRYANELSQAGAPAGARSAQSGRR
jgi:hypothetical protein